jgi:hypothetical protein
MCVVLWSRASHAHDLFLPQVLSSRDDTSGSKGLSTRSALGLMEGVGGWEATETKTRGRNQHHGIRWFSFFPVYFLPFSLPFVSFSSFISSLYFFRPFSLYLTSFLPSLYSSFLSFGFSSFTHTNPDSFLRSAVLSYFRCPHIHCSCPISVVLTFTVPQLLLTVPASWPAIAWLGIHISLWSTRWTGLSF